MARDNPRLRLPRRRRGAQLGDRRSILARIRGARVDAGAELTHRRYHRIADAFERTQRGHRLMAVSDKYGFPGSERGGDIG